MKPAPNKKYEDFLKKEGISQANDQGVPYMIVIFSGKVKEVEFKPNG